MADYMSKIFGASPVKPMQDHMMRATESVARNMWSCIGVTGDAPKIFDM